MANVTVEEKAGKGDTEAQCALAFLFEIGLDRPQNYRQAAHFWQLAAKVGNQLAISKLEQLLRDDKIQTCWLDQSTLPSPNKKPQKEREGGQISQKILLADDEDEIRILTGNFLELAGFKIIHAVNGEEAIQKILANPDIKIIVTDLKMPKLNGLQMVKTLRRMQVAETAKIVMMTAFSQPTLIAEGKKLNVDAWLVKPIRHEALLDTLKRLIERKSQVAQPI